jgi:hypothetical protein
MNWLCHDFPQGMNCALQRMNMGNSNHGAKREIMKLRFYS